MVLPAAVTDPSAEAVLSVPDTSLPSQMNQSTALNNSGMMSVMNAMNPIMQPDLNNMPLALHPTQGIAAQGIQNLVLQMMSLLASMSGPWASPRGSGLCQARRWCRLCALWSRSRTRPRFRLRPVHQRQRLPPGRALASDVNKAPSRPRCRPTEGKETSRKLQCLQEAGAANKNGKKLPKKQARLGQPDKQMHQGIHLRFHSTADSWGPCPLGSGAR